LKPVFIQPDFRPAPDQDPALELYEGNPSRIGPAAMPMPKPSENRHAPAFSDGETEFPRFKKPVGAMAEAAPPAEEPAVTPISRAGKERTRPSRFLAGFIVGVLAAAVGVVAVFLVLIGGDLSSIDPPPQPPRREARIVAPDVQGAPLPLPQETPAHALPPEWSENAVAAAPAAPAPPPMQTPVPAPSASLGQTRLFVHHSSTQPQTAVAGEIAGQLRGGGLSVIDIRRISGTISSGSVRYFFPADREAATALTEMLGQIYRGRNDPREFRLLDFTTYSPKPRERTLEIWLPN
jgi:hypothetical protein